MLPEAPVLFSTSTERPRLALMRCATRRATTSTAEAAANGFTRVTGREGQSCCAFAASESRAVKKTNIVLMTKGYLKLPWGQVHYRTAEGDPALPAMLLLHQS